MEILNNVQYATLATVSAGCEPYNAPVFFMYDDAMNLYWSSSVHSQHSKNIENNGKGYIVIYDSTVTQGTGWGVYIQAEASVVTHPDEAEKASILLGNRRGKSFNKKGTNLVVGIHKIYKAKPIHLWINDAKKDEKGEYVEDYRVSIDMKKVIEIFID